MRIVVQMVIVAVIVSIAYPFLHNFAAPFASSGETIEHYLKVYGEIYGVMVAFVIFVVWGQFANTEAALDKETSNLEALLIKINFLESRLEQDKNDCRLSITRYAQLVIDDEFKSLAKGEESPQADAAFHKLIQQIHAIRIRIRGEQDLEIYGKIQDIVTEAIRCRDERVTISTARMPITLWRLLLFISALMISSSAFLPVQNHTVGYLLFLFLSLICALLLAVINDMDNPFDGVWNLSDQPLRVLINKQKQLSKVTA